MGKQKVYLHGQILGTHSFLLTDGFCQENEIFECGICEE